MDSTDEPSKAVAKRIGGIYEKTIPFRDGLADIFVYNLEAAPQAYA